MHKYQEFVTEIADAEEEIADAEQQLSSVEKQLNDAKVELDAGKTQLDESKVKLDYLEKHYQDSALNVQTLAEVSGVSEIYFRKLFTEIYSMPPKKYISLIRMSKARELLMTGEVTVQQVAEATGFRDVYSFCKSFRKAHECTPTQYRKSHWG